MVYKAAEDAPQPNPSSSKDIHWKHSDVLGEGAQGTASLTGGIQRFCLPQHEHVAPEVLNNSAGQEGRLIVMIR